MEDMGKKRFLFRLMYLKDVSEAKEIAIIGAGPAGLYAALRAVEAGLKPIVFERGKDVRCKKI